MPDDVAEEKVKALHALGATVERVRPASIVDKKQVRTGQHVMSLNQFDIACLPQYVVSIVLPYVLAPS